MIKCPPIAALPEDADLGAIMRADIALAETYGICAGRHNDLVDFENRNFGFQNTK